MEHVDKEEVRKALPMSYAAFELGIPLNADGKRCCPFHDDQNPSFRTWVDDRQVPRWGCFPCGAKGDVYDLIGRIEGTGFTDSLVRARAMLAEMPPEWEGTGGDAPREFDSMTAMEICTAGVGRADLPGVRGFVGVALGVVSQEAPEDYRVAADEFLVRRWCVGVDGAGNTIIPHFGYDRAVTGVKFRELGGGARWAMPGSKFPVLYGSWLPRQHRTILVCEGESDAWWASLQDPPADVLALPAGATSFDTRWLTLEADTWILAFDSDEAGREGRSIWEFALWERGHRYAHIVPPEGDDLRSWKPDLGHIIQSLDTVQPR